jgi:fumarate hydratase subunit beta
MTALSLPASEHDIRSLQVGEPVLLSGTMITGRDAAHKWMAETFIRKTRAPQDDDLAVYASLRDLLAGGAIYHCGPVVTGLDTGTYGFAAAGPTTSSREEPYQAEVIAHFGLRAVIGKGGMGPRTLAACKEHGAVYLHAIGGAATLIAQAVRRVPAVYKLGFGVPEAMWVIEVTDFPAVVTMDTHGRSLHADVEAKSRRELERLLEVC